MAVLATQKIPVAIVGANGYTGVELIRLLLQHPNVELTTITSRQFEGQSLAKVYPSFSGLTHLRFEKLSVAEIARTNKAAFLCLPHHEGMDLAARLRTHGLKLVDLSADFRFQSAKTYEKTYGPHTQKKLLKLAVYGLCEIFAEDIKKAALVAAPGCYVTSILLALAPLVQNQLITLDHIVCDAKSGVSGAGRSASVDKLLTEASENFKAYGIGVHRHRPEIEEKLSLLAGKPVRISFTPHLLPITRGILSTMYVQPLRKWKDAKLTQVFEKFYRKNKFVKVLTNGTSPELKSVVGTNYCHLSAHYDDLSEKIIVVSVLDNLVKGASGQAVQCLNLMFGLPEEMGLTQLALVP